MRALTAIAAVSLLGACAGEVGGDMQMRGFGESVQSNHLAMTASLQVGLLEGAQAQFAAAAPDTVLFAFNSATLDPAARRALDAQARWLRDNPDIRMSVEGHTDLVGGERYNDRLGLRRAQSVAAYLAARGVDPSRLDAVESKGESEPVVPTDEREQANRRAVTEVAGFTHGFVGDGMDGRRALLMYRRYARDSVEAPETASSTGG